MRNPQASNLLLVLALFFAFRINIYFQVTAATNFETSAQTQIEGTIIGGSQTNPQVAQSISSAGDFNKDGIEDIVIGLPAAGTAYIIFGPINGIPDIDLTTPLSSSQGISIIGASLTSQFGYSVSGLGDVNDDEVDDIIVGAYGASTVYVIFGRSTPPTVIDVSSSGITQVIKITGLSGSMFGAAVGRAGNINGDSLNDIMISAPYENSPTIYAGAAYIIYGRASWTSMSVNVLLPQDGFKIMGSASDEMLGLSLNSAGDVNNDGLDDIMVGSAEIKCGSVTTGMVMIVYGTQSQVTTPIQASTLLLSQGVKICGTSTSLIGNPGTISPVGDLNNDGVDDLAIGAYFTAVNSITNAGSLYIINGINGGFPADINLSPSTFNGIVISGNAVNDQIGKSTASGDINGDGILDLVLTTFQANSPTKTQTGIVHVIFGSPIGFSNFNFASPGPLALQIFGDISQAQMGTVVITAKGTNGDSILALGVSKAYIFNGKKCGSETQCTNPSLSPICYVSIGCECSENPASPYFQEGSCVAACSNGYYLSSGICTTCPVSCSVCTSATVCESCNPGFILEGTLCKSQQLLDASDLEEIKTINSITDVTQIVDTATLTAASVIAPHDPGSVTASMLAKMLQYIRYLDVPYSQRLELTFKYHNSTYGPFGIGPNMPIELILQIPLNPIPFRFLKFHVHSSFLVNFWDSLIFISIIFGVLLILVIIEFSWAKMMERKAPYPVIRTIRTAIQNFCLMQFYNVFGDVLLFITLDLSKMTLVTSDVKLGICLAVIFCCIGCIILGIHIYVLVKFSNLRKNESWSSQIEEFSKQYEGTEVLFKHFKDNAFISQSFLLLFVIRNCLFNLILALLPESPVVQASLILTMSILVLLYLIFQRPFKTILNLLQHIICEVVFLIVNTCVLIVARMKLENQDSFILRDKLCEAIIYTSLIFTFIPQVFLALKVAVAVYDWYRKSQNKSLQRQASKEDKLQLRIQKRHQNQGISEDLQYQNSTLEESSIELNMIQNTSNLTLQNNESSFINQTDSPVQARKRHLLDNNNNNQQFQGVINSLKKKRELDQQRFRQQTDSQSSDLLRPSMGKNMMKSLSEMDMIQRNFSENNQPRDHWARKRPNRQRKIF